MGHTFQAGDNGAVSDDFGNKVTMSSDLKMKQYNRCKMHRMN